MNVFCMECASLNMTTAASRQHLVSILATHFRPTDSSRSGSRYGVRVTRRHFLTLWHKHLNQDPVTTTLNDGEESIHVVYAPVA